MITQDETNALIILTAVTQTKQNEVNQSIQARKAMIALLEAKYAVTFNETSGLFEPRG